MTIKDLSHADDAEFDLFLQCKGELSEQLKALPQPVASAALDAGILAAIENELTKESATAKAANDPVGPLGAHAVRPRFSPLWNIPLGLAAGVLVTVMVQMHRHNDQSAATVAQTQQASELAVAKADTSALPGPAAPAATPPVLARTDNPAASPAAAKTHKNRLPQLAMADTAAPKANEPVEQITVTGIRASLQQSLNQKRSAAQNVEVVTSEDVGKMPDKNVVDTESFQSPLTQKRNATSHVDVIASADIGRMPDKNVADTLQPVPGILFDSHAATASAATPETAAAPAIVPPVSLTSTAGDSEKAKAWLDRIAEKLNAGLNKEALEEWAKFHKTYPDYIVPEPIAGKINSLQKPPN